MDTAVYWAETPLCLNHLSPSENLVTGSYQLSLLLSWSSAEDSLLMHAMPPPWDSSHPTSGSGRGIKAQAFASIPENSDGPPRPQRTHAASQGLYYNSAAAHLSLCQILCPGCLWMVPRMFPTNLLHPHPHPSWVYFSGSSTSNVVRSIFSCGYIVLMLMHYYGLNCVPMHPSSSSYVEILAPSISECDCTWR